MTKPLFSRAGRFTKAIVDDLADAVKRERAYAKGEPQCALLFLTYRCTSRCRTCKMWCRPWEVKEELSLEQWKEVADVLAEAGVRAIELFGGDVLLRKDVLIPLIHHFKNNGAIIHIPTNSNLLDTRTAQMLVDSRVDYLYLSTDGVDELHDQVRGVESAFGKVRRAAMELAKQRKGNGTPRLICNTTVSKFNVESLDEVARFANDIGFDEIHFEYVGEMLPEDIPLSAVDGIEPTPYYLRDGSSVLISKQQARVLKAKLRKIRREYRLSEFGINTLNIDCLSKQNLTDGSVPQRNCYTERCEVTVDPGGNVVACPFFHSFRFGNMLEDSFVDTWYGERRQRFHRYLKENGLPMCRHCILSVQRNHSFLTRLKRIYLMRSRALGSKLARVVS